MGTFRTVTIECGDASVSPAALLKHLGHLREYREDAFVHAGNLVVRLYGYDIEPALRDIYSSHEGIGRTVLQKLNDTSDTSTVFLYTYEDDTLTKEVEIKTGQTHDRPTTWYAYRPRTFAGRRAWLPPADSGFSDDVFRYEEQPIVYLQAEYGIHALTTYEVIRPDDYLTQCPPPSLEPGTVDDVNYHVVIHPRDQNRPLTPAQQRRFRDAIAEHMPANTSATVVDLQPEYAWLRVHAPSTEAPRRTIHLIKSSLMHSHQNTDEDLSDIFTWYPWHFCQTNPPSEATLSAFCDGDTTSNHDEDELSHQYRIALETKTAYQFDPATLTPIFDGIATDRNFTVEDVTVRPRAVLATITCPSTQTPWVVGHWLRQEVTTIATERDWPTIPWVADIHAATNDEALSGIGTT